MFVNVALLKSSTVFPSFVWYVCKF